jgi:hypothetical protein
LAKTEILKREFDFILIKKYGKAPGLKIKTGGFCSAT